MADPKAADVQVTTKPLKLTMDVNGKPYALDFKSDTTSKFENDQLRIVQEFNAAMKLTAPTPSKLEGMLHTNGKDFGAGITYRPRPVSGYGIAVHHFKGTTFGSITFPIGNLKSVNEK